MGASDGIPILRGVNPEHPGETTTLWVNKADRRVVKITNVLPEMNGATATAELVK